MFLILHAFYKRSVVVTNVYCGCRHAASFNARLWSWLEKLGTISLLSALFTFPFANWLNAQLMPLLNVPGTVSNVTTMAFVGWIVSAICHQLPWMVPSVAPIAQKRQKQPKIENTQTFQWSIRRTFADFSEAWFYGNELVGGLVILGVLTDWFVNINHITNGSGLVPDILMRQMIASAVGVFFIENISLKKVGIQRLCHWSVLFLV